MSELLKYLDPLETVKCNLCECEDTKVIHDQERFDLPVNTVICNNCGLVYINPRPIEKNYYKMYEVDYRVAVSGTDDWLENKFQEQRGYSQRKVIPFYLRHYKDFSGNLLDVGCSYGGLMMPFKEEFSDVNLFGIEPVVNIAEQAQLKTGAKIHVGPIETAEFSEKFNLIIFARCLNHMLDPMTTIQKARSMLDEQGKLLIILHDAISTLMFQGLSQFTEITHPYIFSPETIKSLLAKAGFKIIGYEDKAFDPSHLSKEDIQSVSFRKRFGKMFILAQKTDQTEISYPDADEIWERIQTHARFYADYKDTASKGLWHEKVRHILSGLKSKFK